MLGFNSIIMAVFAVFMTRRLSLAQGTFVAVGVAAILASSFLLLSVVWVHWSNTRDFNDGDAHALRLLLVRNARTVRYRIAWVCAVASLIALAGLWALDLAKGGLGGGLQG